MNSRGLSIFLGTNILFVGTLLMVPLQTFAAATFTTDTTHPFVSSIALKIGNDFIASAAKTNQNITVIISVDPGTAYLNNSVHILGGDAHEFTGNGSYVFTFEDSYGNTGSSTVTIDNIDRTPPVIVVDSFITTPTSTDITVTASTSEGNINASSTTFSENGTFVFVATDEAGNVSYATTTVSNINKVAPTITLLGSTAPRIRVNNSYFDEGALVTDDVDATTTISASGTVDTSIAGYYTLTYAATDSAGNQAVPVTRTVEVVRGASSSGGGGGSSSRSVSVPVSISSGQVLGAETYVFKNDLEYGQKGQEVTALQEILISEGLLKEKATGYFGRLTEAALKEYQRAHGIPQTGVLGPRTRAAISGEVSYSQGASYASQIAVLLVQVRELQAKLASLQS